MREKKGLRQINSYREVLFQAFLVFSQPYNPSDNTVKAGNVVTFGAQNNFFLRISFR
jgi:hypothetical protein